MKSKPAFKLEIISPWGNDISGETLYYDTFSEMLEWCAELKAEFGETGHATDKYGVTRDNDYYEAYMLDNGRYLEFTQKMYADANYRIAEIMRDIEQVEREYKSDYEEHNTIGM